MEGEGLERNGGQKGGGFNCKAVFRPGDEVGGGGVGGERGRNRPPLQLPVPAGHTPFGNEKFMRRARSAEPLALNALLWSQ